VQQDGIALRVEADRPFAQLFSSAQIRRDLFVVLLPDTGTSEGASLSDNSNLREKAREAIQAGELPSRRADRTWGGPGIGAPCTICRATVTRDEMEIEIEFARDGDGSGCDKYRVHPRCLAAWEFELDQIQPATRQPLPADRRSQVP
jgi:hypothetical protein